MTLDQGERAAAALREIENSRAPMLTAAQVAPVVGCDPHYIRVQAHDDPAPLGFRVIVTGTRTRIPREAFLAYIRGTGVG